MNESVHIPARFQFDRRLRLDEFDRSQIALKWTSQSSRGENRLPPPALVSLGHKEAHNDGRNRENNHRQGQYDDLGLHVDDGIYLVGDPAPQLRVGGLGVMRGRRVTHCQ